MADLPLESKEWGYLSTHFVEAVSSLRTALAQRASQAEAAAELAGVATALVDAYSEALAFLEIDALERLTRPTGSWATPLAARDLLEKLGALLAEYDGVRNLAHTRTEEEIRRAHRIDLEAQIDDIFVVHRCA